MVDVDRFKDVNDSRGHDVGDLVLRTTAERIVDACRGQDVAGRWGGEEFLVIAPFTDIDRAAKLGERIRSNVAVSPVPVAEGGGSAIVVTVSVGVTSGFRGVETLLREADAAMYVAKGSGRNCVIASGGE
jgi:two-component system cell cycle response regulator